MSSVPLKKKTATSIDFDYDNNETNIQLHNTVIVKIFHNHKDKTRLNTGGWKTATTKRRMNEASYEYNLGFHVFQKNKSWFVKLFDGQIVEFFDNMIIPTN